MNSHLINCISMNELERFVQCGYVGVGPFYPSPNMTNRQVSKRLQILWDVIADLKRVRPGDVLFLHSEGIIVGPFIFETTFLESAQLPPILQSHNLSPDQWLSSLSEFSQIQMEEYGYVAAIVEPSDSVHNRANLMEIFLRQSMGTFNAIPPRFMYGDTKKIVKPLLRHELLQLLDILNHSTSLEVSQSSNYSTSGLREIELDLHNYGGHLFCEKILEAWFMENMHPSSNNYEMVSSILGEFNAFSNSIYTYYTNFLDVFAYHESTTSNITYCNSCNSMIKNIISDMKIVELKRDWISDYNSILGQVQSYLRWACSVLNPNANATAFIVAAGFSQEFIREAANQQVFLLRYVFTGNGIELQRV